MVCGPRGNGGQPKAVFDLNLGCGVSLLCFYGVPLESSNPVQDLRGLSMDFTVLLCCVNQNLGFSDKSKCSQSFGSRVLIAERALAAV